MDPGLEIDHAVQTRRGNQFSLQERNSDRSYQLVAVAEQGTLQDSRPFAIVDARGSGKQQYQNGSANNVSPFFFAWTNQLGQLTASLEVDTATDAYFYRNQPGLATTPASPTQRDLPRTIYQTIPADAGNPGLPQLKNSLDDFVHMAFFERDVTTSTEFLTDLETLSYSMTLRAGSTSLDHPFNYQQNDPSQGILKPRTGSRIVTSIHWSEDRDRNGVHEIYLIEINIGGESSYPSWGSTGSCVSDGNSHGNLISGQYLILGGESILNGQGLPLSANQVQNITVDWGRILRQLKDGNNGAGCQLNATLEHVPNTIALGVAVEARGGVVQALEVAASTAHHENTIPASLVAQELLQSAVNSGQQTGDDDVPVLPQTVAALDNSVVTNLNDDQETVLPDSASSQLPALEVAVVDSPSSSIQAPESLQSPAANSAEASGEPYVQGSEIRLPVRFEARSNLESPTWWQILSAGDWSVACPDINNIDSSAITFDGSANVLRCAVTPGLYSVIEHVSGERWDNLAVFTVDTDLSVANPSTAEQSLFNTLNSSLAGVFEFDTSAQALRWQEPGWYQVQRSRNFESVCESRESCVLEPGIYQVTNLTTGQRWPRVIIPQ